MQLERAFGAQIKTSGNAVYLADLMDHVERAGVDPCNYSTGLLGVNSLGHNLLLLLII